MKESTLQTSIRRALADAGAYVRKNHGSAYGSARPDLSGCLGGRYFGFEVKVPGNDATLLQTHELAEIRQAGGWAGVVTSVAQVTDIIRRWPLVCRICLGELARAGESDLWCPACREPFHD